MKTDSKRRFRFFLAYTCIFAVMASAFYMIFSVKGRTLVSSVDGVKQHYKALIYYARYLRSIFGNLAAGNGLVIPQWEFNLGEGNDILQTLHYYVIGDPFAFFSFLVPEKCMYFYYDGMIMLRMYCAGLSFALLCGVTGQNDFTGKLAGSITYAFCFWAIAVSCRHPYFLNPLIYCPLLIAGIELILKGKRPYLFIAAVMISALSNFYFFYMLVLLTVLYAVVRYLALLITRSVEIKKLLCLAGKTILASAVGAALAGVILLPICRTFVTDARTAVSYAFHWFYPVSYYLNLPGHLISSMSEEYVLLLGYSPILLFAVFLLFRDKKNGMLKTLFLTGLLFACFPLFGKILNGNAYITNRWSWAFAVLCCYLLVKYWQRIIHPDFRTAAGFALFLGIYAVICWRTGESWKPEVWSALVFAAGFLGFVFAAGRLKAKFLTERIVPAVSVLAVCIYAYCVFAPKLEDEWTLSADKLDIENNEAAAVKQIAAEENVRDFFRYSGSQLTTNSGLLNGVSGADYYWSNANPAVVEYRNQLELIDEQSYRYSGYDRRAALETLSSVLYYAVPDNTEQNTVPYGFSYIDTFSPKGKNSYKIFRNNNYLSIGYGYKHYISYDEWSGMNPVEKEEAMLQGIVLEGYTGDLSEIQPELTSEVLSIEDVILQDGVTREGDSYVVSEGTGHVILEAEGDGNAEYFVRFSNIDCQQFTSSEWENGEYPFSVLPSNSDWGWFMYTTPEYTWYAGRKNYMISFGYCEDFLTDVKIELTRGRYDFDNIEIIRQPMDHYEDEAYELYENSLTDVQIGTDTVSGKITADEPMMMCFSIPYSDGWKATVDGKEAKVWRANVKNMAVEVGTGEHEIRLTYSCPWKREGMILSAMGLLAFAVLALAEERKRRQGEMQNEN